MLLSTILDKFIFDCQCRKLSEKTIKNYAKQISYSQEGEGVYRNSHSEIEIGRWNTRPLLCLSIILSQNSATNKQSLYPRPRHFPSSASHYDALQCA